MLFSHSRIRSDSSLASLTTILVLSKERHREKLMNNIIRLEVFRLHWTNLEMRVNSRSLVFTKKALKQLNLHTSKLFSKSLLVVDVRMNYVVRIELVKNFYRSSFDLWNVSFNELWMEYGGIFWIIAITLPMHTVYKQDQIDTNNHRIAIANTLSATHIIYRLLHL